MSGKINERILLYKAQTEHDSDAFGGLYDQYVRQIYRFVFFKVGSKEEAEDITSDVFLKAWNYLNEKKEINSFSGLLYRIARNSIIDLYRSRSAKPESVSTENIDVADSGAWYAEIGDKMEAGRITGSLKKLKQEYQEVITLRYVDELEISEIAEITGKGNIAVRVTLHRAIKKLKEIVEV